jgi:branched-chain amino acid transport system ATP-binding protein
MSTSEILRCTDLRVERSGQPIIRDTRLSVAAGTIVALSGPNGSGKTTLLEAIAGLIPTQAGEISLFGRPVRRMSAHERAGLGLRFVPDRAPVFPNLTIEENFDLQKPRLDSSADVESVFSSFPFLSRNRQKAGLLSGGERRILAVLCALRSAPKLLIIDEFSEGMQQSAIKGFVQEIRRLCQAGSACILVVHSPNFASDNGFEEWTIRSQRVGSRPAV